MSDIAFWVKQYRMARSMGLTAGYELANLRKALWKEMV